MIRSSDNYTFDLSNIKPILIIGGKAEALNGGLKAQRNRRGVVFDAEVLCDGRTGASGGLDGSVFLRTVRIWSQDTNYGRRTSGQKLIVQLASLGNKFWISYLQHISTPIIVGAEQNTYGYM